MYRRRKWGLNRGGILIMTLVFVMMFTIIFISLSGLTGRQFREGTIRDHEELAFQIAEAGLNYARWRLAHNPDDFTPIEENLEDQFGTVVGTYSVTVAAPVPGSTMVIITSTGETADSPAREFTLQARYGIPSLARYSSVFNSDYWFGSSDTISGVAHSNGGIRMDGTSNSLVTSARETYVCQAIHGCSPSAQHDGVWGAGTNQDLWEFPVPPVDFNSLTLDLLSIKETAQALTTYYGNSGAQGYHIVFNDTNTYSIYEVTGKTANVRSWTPASGSCKWDSHDIGSETFIETKSVPSNGVIFVEDHVWVEGDIRDRITVAAGRFPDNPANNVDIILNGDISYEGVRDGSRTFGAIAQRDLLIPWSGAEDVLDLDGAYIAQKGSFGRRYYGSTCGSSGQAHNLKSELNVYGMVGLNELTIDTTWVNGSGTVISGYQTTSRTYDPNLLYQPPPYFPTTGQYEFISWEQFD